MYRPSNSHKSGCLIFVALLVHINGNQTTVHFILLIRKSCRRVHCFSHDVGDDTRPRTTSTDTHYEQHLSYHRRSHDVGDHTRPRTTSTDTHYEQHLSYHRRSHDVGDDTRPRTTSTDTHYEQNLSYHRRSHGFVKCQKNLSYNKTSDCGQLDHIR